MDPGGVGLRLGGVRFDQSVFACWSESSRISRASGTASASSWQLSTSYSKDAFLRVQLAHASRAPSKVPSGPARRITSHSSRTDEAWKFLRVVDRSKMINLPRNCPQFQNLSTSIPSLTHGRTPCFDHKTVTLLPRMTETYAPLQKPVKMFPHQSPSDVNAVCVW